MVGSADEYGIDGRILQHLVVVGVSCHLLFDAALGVFLLDDAFSVVQALGIDIAHGGEAAEVCILEKAWHIHGVRNAPVADDGEICAAIGSESADASRRKDKRRREGGGTKELTAVDFHCKPFCVEVILNRA